MADNQQPSPRQDFIDAMVDLEKASSKVKQVVTDYKAITEALLPVSGDGGMDEAHYRAMGILRLVWGDK